MSGIILPMNAMIDSMQPEQHDFNAYQVQTPVYEGPLDLLLQLIERAELDITKLALAQVTEQYLSHIRELTGRIAAEEVSAFLVIAARLLQIKSEILLPRQIEREIEEEDPGEALARQLRIYKRFKEIGTYLSNLEASGVQAYLRVAPPPRIESKFELEELTLDQLIEAAETLFSRVDQPTLGTVVKPPRITIRDKIDQIYKYLRSHRKSTFLGMLSSYDRLEVVVTFLAMLELIKRRLVYVHQENLFGDIEVEQREEWDENEAFELEFGE